jgi:hypothetical protein
MAEINVERWVCKENITRFQIGLQDQPDEANRLQLTDLLSRELCKLHAMFPDRQRPADFSGPSPKPLRATP